MKYTSMSAGVTRPSSLGLAYDIILFGPHARGEDTHPHKSKNYIRTCSADGATVTRERCVRNEVGE